MQRHAPINFNALHSTTILNDRRIAYCTKLASGKTSKALIYNTHEKKVILIIESQPGCQIQFFRTSSPTHALYYNDGPPYNEIKDSKNAISEQRLQQQSSLEDILSFIDNSKPSLDNLFNENTFLFNIDQLTTEIDEIRWDAQNVITTKNQKIYIEKPLKQSLPGASTSTEYNPIHVSTEYNHIHVQLKKLDTDQFFDIYVNPFWELYTSDWYTHPEFHINLNRNNNNILIESKINILLESCCNLRKNTFLLGYYLGLGHKSNKPFGLCIYDLESKKRKKAIYIDDVIAKLLYISEKEVVIGLVENKNLFYIFDKKLNYKIIPIKNRITDVALLDHCQNKIHFSNGEIIDLETLINPHYISAATKEINASLQKLPTVLTKIIIDYSLSKNKHSLFTYCKSKSESSLKDRFLEKIGWRK